MSVCLLFVLIACFSAVAPASAQSRLNRPAPKYFQLGPPDQKEGAAILEEMRAVGPEGDYYLEFELRVLPRRGDGPTIPGRMWGGRNSDGPLSRMSLLTPADSTNATGGGAASAVESRILVQGGPRPAAWRWPAADGSSVISVDDSALFAPLAGTNLSAFDLQMPFLFWTDFVYEGKTRLKNRPVNTFLLYPPASLAKHRPDLAGIRVYLDPQYNALVQAEQIGERERVLKTFWLGGFVKIDERWIPRSFELREETTRDKTRLVVMAAALNLDFAAAVFDPGALSSGLRPPAPLTRLAE
ncbi:MAG: outer membrane lipoprotein-sorting protein [Burkholderiales bacterium]|nr:outer membrane lipoprotein-sorting protein [Opitutaceae bacterium]